MADRETLSKYLRKVTGELRAAQRRVLDLEQQEEEPIAIVGMACRYPGGVESPAGLWDLVRDGEEGITEFPTDRGWDLERLYDPDPDRPFTTHAREGGFLSAATEFDPEFFAIAPREAEAMDPQQRLLLEASWEALESAGIDPTSLKGKPAGVFAGMMNPDYGTRLARIPEELEGYFAAGVATSVLSGRIAYQLGLEGPAMTVDTACSSSLVAMHLAAQSLRSGECSLALAGGVTVLSTPGLFIEFSRQRGLAPDGRCKSFAEGADGTGFSEGVGLLVLERLSEAQRNGHQVLATIKGSAVNQDGASNGLTAPNGPSQERVIRQALANAGLEPQDVDMVEAHGTGTTLGDPIEAGALLATYGQEREAPLKLGSIKSNIGHTQAAAGVAGVIKAVMAMREGILPKTLHAAEPSTKVEWEAGEIELLSEACPWQPNGRPRRAGVSSFGISGTNAHLILEEAPVPSETGQGAQDETEGEATAPLPGPLPFVLSAKSEAALKEQAQRLAAHLRANPELDPTDVAYSLATTRAAFEHRAVAIGSDREQLLEGLGALGEGAEAAGLCRGQARAQQRPAMLFGGQGSQHPGMALELLESSAAFAAHMRECERALDPHVEWSLEEVLREGEAKWLDRLDIVQPALFAVMVSLARLWGEMGVRPALVAGHSQGEIAAAHIAGGLSLDDAALVIARRAGAMAKLAGKGGMLSLSLGAEALAPRLEPFGARLALAAINGPASLVVSGEPEALVELKDACEADGVHCKPIAVDYAAHSAQIEDLREELLEAFEPISPQSGEIPMHSTVTGEPIDTAELGPEYWYRNLRQTVLLEPVFRSLLGEGQRTFIEVSPHPVLGFGLQEAIDAQPAAQGAAILATLHREHAGPERFALSHAEAHANGVAIDWEAFFAPTAAKAVALPTYAFQRERYWIAGSPGAGDAGSIGQRDPEHPLLGAMIEDPAGEGLTFTASLSLASHPWLADHAVAGTVLLPGTAFLELALHAGELAGAAAVEELTLIAPLPIPEAGAIGLQVSVGEPGPDGERPVSIHSRTEADPDEEPQWVQNASGTLLEEASAALEPLTAWPPKAAQPLDIDDLYGALADAGLQYGPAFQGLRAAWREGQDVYAEVSLAPEQSGEAAGFGIHPALLDAALHAIAALGEPASEQSLRLPFAWSGVHLLAAGASELRVAIRPDDKGGFSLAIADSSGAAIAAVGSLALRPVSAAQLAPADSGRDGLLAAEWSEASLERIEGQAAVLWELAAEPGEDQAQAARRTTASALRRIQEWLSLDQEAEEPERRLAILTQGAIASGEEESPDPALAAAWGLVRSAQAEHPGRFLLIDSDGSEASEQALARALESDGEPQLALREGVALAPRAVPVKSEGDLLAPPSGPWRLDAPERGSLKSLALVPNPAALEPLAPNQVRVAMHAAGLNFRDVLVVLGFGVPGEGALGGDGAGIVLEVGSEVDDLAPGERVMGLIAESFSPLAVCDRRLLVPMPDGWSFEQAASVPVVSLTAYYGLFDLAALQPGEKLLVHAGAGGVGMAAIGLARHLGAEVFATASPSKWDALREMGLEDDQIASSRDLEFKQKFLEVTDGEGVDVVLNSLAGEFVDASLELLPRGGRFMEMGQTDIREAGEVAAEHPGVSYRAFDLVDLGAEDLQGMLAEIASLFEAGALRHAPITSWDLRRAPEAFRHLREGKNVGKVVFEVPRSIDPERTVLITGATGGLGSLVARHIVAEHGARHLLLVSRSGERAAGAMELKQELEEIGAEASIVACDVSERSQLQALLASIPEEHPLGAVIHAAGALEDTTIESLSAQSLEPVFAPKADAAWHLHELTRESELSAFVMFSSAAGVLGSPGQGNYAAANAFLDALAQERRAEGLPAASIAWGLWERRSALTAGLGEADLARMRLAGIEPLSEQHGLALFDQALAVSRSATVALGLNRAGLRSQAAAGVLPAIMSSLVRSPARRRSASASSLAKTLASTPEAEREALVLSMVRTEVAAVLGHAGAEAIEPTRAFKDLGFDSLAAVELRNRLQAATGLRLPATTVFDYPNPAALAGHLLDAVSVDGASKQIAVRALASEEPIAIVGMACRYPGGASAPEQLWALLAAGRDAIGGFPTDRGWDLERLYDSDPDVPGTSYAREGGFLVDADRFDAAFFGIGPREALATDPQQRLLLEAAWEALEQAGVDPSSLKGKSAGVFSGISSSDYGSTLRHAPELEGHAGTGNLGSVLSGRIAYQLGLEGPAITVDTACSSSLVAMHLAAQSLRSGECSLALAGGVTVLSTPGAFVEFSRQRGLAPDGRCKSFAEAADGTGFSEGVGLLVLERLSEAQRNGHQVLATIKGSAVNQDGASNGLTAPNGPSQERVIRQALANAGLKPQDVDMVEAHGTGTTLGDPIEAGALLATYGQEREAPLKLGSIKSNIGHTQAAAGVAGVIKAVMAMREGILPKTLHAAEPSTKVEWEAGEIELLSEACPWQPNGRPRRAGVSSFGISGTNAHLILEEAPVPAEAEPGTGDGAGQGAGDEAEEQVSRPLPFVLSAKSQPALKEQAQRLAAHLRANPELDPTDVAYSLATTRAAFEHRAVAIGSDREQLLEGLGALAQGSPSPGAVSAKAASEAKLAYLLTGQGSQRVGMGKGLHETYPTYSAALDQACAELDRWGDRPLAELLFAAPASAEARLLDHTTYAQPALFATEVALYRLLESWGLHADLLCGHSIGEITAAHIAGVFDLPDAARLVAARGRLMGELPTGGAMVAIEATEAEAMETIEGKGKELAIASINGPSSVVLSGAEAAIEAAGAEWKDRGRKTKRLAVSHAFHSPLMEPMLERFEAEIAELTYNPPTIAILSNSSGEPLSPEQATDPAYWVSHVREPVRFMDGVRTLVAQGASALIELGPDPVLIAMARECLEEEGAETLAFAPALREGYEEPETLSGALAQAHATGIEVDWEAFFAGTGAKAVALPTYAFQRERYWLGGAAAAGDAGSIGLGDPDHPLLGAVIEDPVGEGLEFTGRLSLSTHPWLADHAVAGTVLLAGTAFLELALAAGSEVGCETVDELVLQAPLPLLEGNGVRLRVSLGAPGESGSRSVSIHSRAEGEAPGEWSCHAEGTLSSRAVAGAELPAAWPPPGAEPADVSDLYDRLAEAGFDYGPAFQGLVAAWRRGEETFAEVSLPAEQAEQAGGFSIHPALLDAALHAGSDRVLGAGAGADGKPMMPFAWSGVRVHARGARSLRVRLGRDDEEGALIAVDDRGAAVVSIGALATREVDPSRLRSAAARRSLYRIDWAPVAPAVTETASAALIDAGETVHGEAGLPEVAHDTVVGILEGVQQWLVEEEPEDSRLAILTHGAVAVGVDESPSLVSAPLWGLLRSAQSENPGRFLLIDTDDTPASQQALSTALGNVEEPQLALREGRLLAPRLTAAAQEAGGTTRPIDPDSTVLITGATGGLGSIVAHHLLTAHGVRHLLLVSRSGRNAAGAEALAAELEELGAEAEIVACDVADREQLEQLLGTIPADRPLGAVIHCAGVLEDGLLGTIDRSRLDVVMRPKLDAAWHLHELTAESDLSAFVTFSSAAAALGSPGQGSYAAANAFLDALAQHRRANGQVATSIAWGPWEEAGGMAAELGDAGLARLERSGITALSAEQGLELFDATLASPVPVAVPIRLNSGALRAMAAGGILPTILRGLVRSPSGSRSSAPGSLAAKLAGLPAEKREGTVLDLVRSEVAAVLGFGSAAAVDPGKAFKDLGFDSLAAVELRNRLGVATATQLPATLVFDYPTATALAAHLLDAVSADGASQQVAVRAQASEEPIAIVGMACRYPGGVESPAGLWDLVRDGEEGITEFPTDRGWDLERLYDPDPDRPFTTHAREGGFLSAATEFDPEFFAIAPREAEAMDPQQRLLLEASWEALESAGIDPTSLKGKPAGVFAGMMNPDYGTRLARIPEELEGYFAAGVATSVLSGRIAYQLGLEGPAMTVDTACSSSLVAMHLAAQSLRSGECSLALAGGVTVLSTPGLFIEFSRQRGLAPDGRCKSFAEGADGVGWAEGAGMLVLERLSEAQRNGHQVLATIKGSAVNQDGASNGLTAPNGPSQERVIRQALANAGLEPQDVDMVEAHGTGTTLGDPIEAGALLATYGQEREAPLKLGSIKSNIGHTQAAAGVAGVIKAVMAMREGILPKTLHAAEPSTKVEWEAGEIELLSEACPWQPNGRPRRAGVSSFGISGTNAHLILEEAPVPSETGQGAQDETEGEATAPLPGPLPFVLSAKSEAALKEQAQRLAAHLRANPELDPTDVAYSLATTRAAFEHRAVAIGSDREQLLEGLGALGEGAEAAGLCRGQARAQQRPAMLFGGQGSQHPGMALELLESSAAFAAHMRECERALDPHVEWSLEEVLREGEAKWLDRLDIVQPALFAVMVSLARLWGEMGVRPALVAGHSQGEIAAAHIAGGLSLDDAALVIARRAGAMAKLAGKGGMLSLSLGAEALAPRLEPFGARLALAAINGPASLVVSGEPEALVELKEACEADGVHCKPIAVDYAAHSAQIEDLREELLEAFEPISPQSGEIPMHSTVTGEPIDTAELGPEYWYRNLRQTVLLEPVFRSLLGEGQRTFIEVSPHPVLGFGLQEAIDAQPAAQGAAILATLHREHAGPERFALSHAEAHANGVAIDWEAFFAPTAAKAVALPTYAFQRERYWIAGSPGAGDAGSIGQRDPEHPLLGAMIEDPAGEGLTFTASLSLASHPWLADHAVAGTVLLPGTAFLELALHAGELAGAAAVEELTLIAPLPIPEAGAIGLQVSVGEPGPDGERPVSIHSRTEADPDEEPQWVQNASGTLLEEASAALEPLTAWPPKAAQPLDIDDLYGALADAGLQYGPAFQGLRAAWREGQDVYAEVSLAPEQSGEAAGFGIHPALLDAALHAIAALGEPASEQSLRLPFAWSGVHLLAAGASELRVAIRPDDKGGFSLAIADSSGAAIAAVGSLALRPVSAAQLAPADSGRDGLLAAEWSEASLERIEGQAAVLWELAAEPGEDQAQAARRTTASALRRIQEWLSLDQEAEEPERRLAILTQGAIASGEEESPDPALAAAWGLVRSAQAEHPGRFLLIDSDGSEASEQALARALESDGEPQLALREGVALAPRAVPVKSEGDLLAPPSGPWRLDAPERGSLKSLALVPNPAALEPLAPNQVRVAMHAAGLNFRDVLVVLGFGVPGEGALGGDGAGIVLEVGSEVDDLAPGERVMGLIAESFSPLAVCDRRLLVPMPDGWSFEQAASVPVVSLTAYYGLADLAALQPGEKLLVHAGAGGVGMAAIGLARHLGAEVFATASPSKWDALREMGLEDDQIASSRDLEFKQKFLEVTDGEGVDVVLNSLAGEFVDASLELLPRGGRFMEMGQTDIREAGEVAAEHPGVSYRAFDLVDLGAEDLQGMLAEIASLFEAGALRHAPITSWDLRRAPEAFRHLREGKNVGKVVFEVPRSIDPERTVLITGATGGLGSLVARHIVAEHGARHLLLVSRSGERAAGAMELKQELEEIGAEASIVACDVSERSQLQALLASIPEEHPLGAVIHAAGALEDTTIESLSAQSLEPVFAPKADAAWHLHELTRESELSAFVMFSSAAGVLGSPGQGNYAAANAFLDALAQERRAEGLPAASIAWGLWERRSALTAGLGEADLARMRLAGIEPLSEQHGLALFDQALAVSRSATVALGLNRAGLRSQAAAGVLPAIMSSLVRSPARRRSASASSLAKTLASTPEAEREALVLSMVRTEVAAVLGHAGAEAIEPTRAFKDLGFDSLAAVELRNRLQAATGLRLPATTVFDYPNPAALAGHLVASIAPEGTAEPVLESKERQIRETLASIPLSRLRGAGLLDSLLWLAEAGSEGEQGVAENGEIDTMDVEELIRESVAGTGAAVGSREEEPA